jgi:hypothetical protein
MRTITRLFPILYCLALVGCTAQLTATPSTSTVVASSPNLTEAPSSTATLLPSATFTAEVTGSLTKTSAVETPSPTPDTRLLPEDWQNWPVVPQVSPWLKTLYAEGLAAGNNPQSFSKVGDCQNVDSMFLSPFDVGPEYRLGENYAYLQSTIDQFAGSWERHSQAVRGGFNVASVFSPMMSDKSACGKDETPLDCEFRLNQPSIVIISMETWWSKRPAETYETYLRQIVEYVLAHKAVPILATKADNLEGDWSINAAVARVAYDYDVPLWNFWAAVQPLPNHGLTTDGFHLTTGATYLDDPDLMKRAWPWRNLTALQSLDAVWNAVK